MAKKTKKQKDRRERRFSAESVIDVGVVRLVGALGAALLGAGAWGQWFRPTTDAAEPLTYAYWLLAAGAVLTGIALWLGSNVDPPLRVGDGGLALEKGEIVRLPWWSFTKIRWNGDARALLLEAKDENDQPVEWKLAERAYPQGIGWIIHEAARRIPNVLELSPEELDSLDHVDADGGELLRLEPLQVVGKRCAVTGKLIAYEPDARVCPRCERVYTAAAVPAVCACGASLANLQGSDAKPAAARA